MTLVVKTKYSRMARILILIITFIMFTTACNASTTESGNEMDAKDVGGLTLAQVKELTLEEQFNLAGERYNKLQILLAGAQKQLSSEKWLWGSSGLLPETGQNGGIGDPLPGANGENSYYLVSTRIFSFPGSTGSKDDLEPMRKYFEQQGWDIRVESFGEKTHRIWGDTGEGFQLEYGVQNTGQYYLTAWTELYWVNTYDELFNAIADRYVGPPPTNTVPGDFEAFPKWSDPIVNP